MDRKVALKWAEVLRSGRYKQARGLARMCLNNEFDPLGVLCDISKQGTWEFDAYGNALERSPHFPPSYVMKVTKLTQEGMRQVLEWYQDGQSFYVIGDLIERNWESL